MAHQAGEDAAPMEYSGDQTEDDDDDGVYDGEEDEDGTDTADELDDGDDWYEDDTEDRSGSSGGVQDSDMAPDDDDETDDDDDNQASHHNDQTQQNNTTMPPVYSRDATVAAFLAAYTYFCASPKYNPEPHQLAVPPQGGWDTINAVSCAGMKKNDTVIDLLRHLPYIRDKVYMPFECQTIDYATEAAEGRLAAGSTDPILDCGKLELPEYMVYTTMDIDESWLFDTSNGTMRAMGENGVPEDADPDHGPGSWHWYPVWPLIKFFENVVWEVEHKEHFFL